MAFNDVKISCTSPSFSKNKHLSSVLREHFPASRFNDKGIRFNKESLINFLSDADGAIIGLEDIDQEVLEQCPRLKIISKYGVGLDNIDLDACKASNVQIGWTGGVNSRSVAEMTLGFMLMLTRNLYCKSVNLKKGLWEKDGGSQLTNKSIGIVGLGSVGKDLVSLLQPFKCKILVNDIVDQKNFCHRHGLVESSKIDLIRRSDIITIHTPLTPDTKHMCGEDWFSKMKRTAFFINTSRGLIVDQTALKKALSDGLIAGAAIDVYAEEPPMDTQLLQQANLISTPHIGGNSAEAINSMGLSAINHLKRFFE